MPEEHKKEPLFRASEIVIMFSGALFLLSAYIIFAFESLTLWFGTILLYVVGVTLFFMNR